MHKIQFGSIRMLIQMTLVNFDESMKRNILNIDITLLRMLIINITMI
jgi:hypothetical protein